jgi:hypothetical protein
MSISGGPISSAPISGNFGVRLPQNWVVNLNDSVIASDLVSLAGGNALTENDGVNASDVISRVVTYIRTTADAAAAVDAITKGLARVRTLADSAGAVDVFARQLTLARTFNDLAGAADAITSIDQHFGRVFNDTAGAEDAIGVTRLLKIDDVAPAVDQISLHPTVGLLDFVEAVDAITLTLARTSLRLEAAPTICYVADVSTSACYRLTADPASQLFIESVEEYSPEVRSPAHAE